MEPITWATHGFGMGRRYSGRRRHPSIILRLLQVRSFWRVRRPILSAYHVAVERLRLDAVIAIDCSVCSGFSGGVDQNTTWLWDQVGATDTQLSARALHLPTLKAIG